MQRDVRVQARGCRAAMQAWHCKDNASNLDGFAASWVHHEVWVSKFKDDLFIGEIWSRHAHRNPDSATLIMRKAKFAAAVVAMSSTAKASLPSNV